MKYERIIIGGGAAGIAAAIAAAECGKKAVIYEKNEKLGKKLYITGKGRCNVTNNCDMDQLFAGVVTNKRFLYSAFYGFTNTDIMELLEDAGCRLKTERGGRVFPVSDKSSDVISALSKRLRALDVDIRLNKGAMAGGGCLKRRDSGAGVQKGSGLGRYRCDGRPLLSDHRFNRRRVPLCKRGGPQRDRDKPGPGSFYHGRDSG